MAWSWETGQALVATLAPLVGVPLGVITFYLRSLYEHQTNRHAELVRRFELVERLAGDLNKTVSNFALDYTTKEEWLRECMYARGRMERITEKLACETSSRSTEVIPEITVGDSAPHCSNESESARKFISKGITHG